MTTQFQRNVADKICEEIENAQGMFNASYCLTKVDDFNDFGRFSSFMQLPIQNRGRGIYGNVFLHPEVNLRKIVNSIKRVCKKHNLIYDLKINCPEKKFQGRDGMKIFDGYSSNLIQISFVVNEIQEKKPEVSIQEKRNSVPFGD